MIAYWMCAEHWQDCLLLFLVILDAPDTVLIERAQGRRVDPKTGGVYHWYKAWFSLMRDGNRSTIYMQIYKQIYTVHDNVQT